MPGLMRGMARTAAVVGTATATRNAVNRRSASKSAPAPTSPPPAEVQYVEVAVASPEDDLITQLERLGALKAQGLLTEEEYAAEKTKLLNP